MTESYGFGNCCITLWEYWYIVARTTLDVAAYRKIKPEYDSARFIPAWGEFVKAVPRVKPTKEFRYDIVNLTRQIHGNYASPLQQQIVAKTVQKLYENIENDLIIKVIAAG